MALRISFPEIILFFIALLSGIIPVCSQPYAADYSPLRTYQAPDDLIEELRQRFSTWSEKTTFDNKKIKLAFEQFSKQRGDYFHSLDSLDVLMYTDSISVFLNSIKNEIIRDNPALKTKSYYVFTQRSIEPNAYSLGEGIIMVSLGLLERLNSVDQIAFILGHEMGHDYLQHGFKEGIRFCERFYDPKFQQSLSKIKRKTAGRNTKLKNLVNSFRADHMSHSRKNEMQADSFGFVTFAQAGFDTSAAIQSLDVLDKSDHLLFTDTLVLQSYFDFPTYPFKPRWLSKENSMPNWKADEELYAIPDSLKTHPDCDLRIAELKGMNVPGKINQHNASPLTNLLEKESDRFSFEVLESVIQSKDYVVALYMSLHWQKVHQENFYLKCVTAHCLHELGGALIRNEYQDYVEFPDHDYSPGYNHMLAFLHNMNSNTLNQLFTQYKLQHFSQATSHPYVGYLNTVEDRDVTKEDIEKYKAVFKDEYFIRLLEKQNE